MTKQIKRLVTEFYKMASNHFLTHKIKPQIIMAATAFFPAER